MAAREIDALLPATSRTSWTGTWIPLVRVPPSGTWERRRADLFRLAAEWIAPEEVSEDEPGSSTCSAGTWRGSGRPGRRRRPTGRASRGRRSKPAARAACGCAASRTRTAAAPRPPAPALPDEDVARAPALPRDVGRRAPRARTARGSPARAVPAARLLDQAAPVRRDLPRRRRSRRALACRAGEGHSDSPPRAFRAAAAGARRELREEAERLVRFHEPDATSYVVR